jgi:hypothetical protein
MKRSKIILAGIWCINIFVIVALAYSVMNSLLLYEPDDYIGQLAPPEERIQNNNTPIKEPWEMYVKIMKQVGNPLEKIESVDVKPESVLIGKVKVIGAAPSLKDPRDSFAILYLLIPGIPANMKETVVFLNEQIKRRDGTLVSELADWVLKEVYKDHVVFANDKREVNLPVVDLERPTSFVSTSSPPSRYPSTFDPKNFKSRLLKYASNERRKTWLIDRREIEWLAQNQENILANDVSISPYRGGGIKINSVRPGSVVEYHGFRAGDVIKRINGIPVNSLSELRSVAERLRRLQPSSINVVVNRAGRLINFYFRPQRGRSYRR